jgi:[ribosomal protein S18]-alanine N-acetyltransferase
LPGEHWVIRRAGEADLGDIAAIQQASPEASQWAVADYLYYDSLVAQAGGRIGGFLVSRALAPGESEILNLAVQPDYRRQGVARALMRHYLAHDPGVVFLEVRKSNTAAIEFYNSMGFKEFAARRGYYESPAGSFETAIVMRLHPC